MGSIRKVLVLNHFAAPLGHPGGTRHVELFSRIRGWQYLIVASNRNLLTGDLVPAEPGFHTVAVAGHSTNGWRRVMSWIDYARKATWVGVRTREIDVVYASSPHLLAGVAGMFVAAWRRRPLILEVRDLWPQVLVDMDQIREGSRLHRFLERIERTLYRYASYIVTMAPGTDSSLLSQGVPQSKLVYIPNAADPDDFLPSQSRASLRQRYGFTRFTLVYAGAHGPANGLSLLLEAAAQVRHLDLEIVLVGGGVSKDSLIEQAMTQGLNNVQFRDPVPKSSIPDLLHAADAGLHVLADVEIFQTAVSPNKLFDYMAAGLPVITNCPGFVATIVEESGAGLAGPPNSLATLLTSAFQAFQSGDWAPRGVEGRNWISEHQTRRAMASRLQNLLAMATSGSSVDRGDVQ